MSKKRILILIPARFASTRFPGKPLEMINGVSMIERVFRNCAKTSADDFIVDTYVVTDDQRIEDHVKTFTTNIVRVDDNVISGSLRIQLAFGRFFSQEGYELVINVQGDEPLLTESELIGLIAFHLERDFDICTLVKRQIGFGEDFLNSNKVKVVLSEETGRALYFSRSPIPFKRDLTGDFGNDYWFLHIGVYSYRPKALIAFADHSETRLENLEKLEQLRAMEMGQSIGAFEISSDIIGVDVPEDIKKVEEVLNGRK